MNIIISDIKKALEQSKSIESMKAIGEHLAIKLNNRNFFIIGLKTEHTQRTFNTYIIYTVKIADTGNTLEENYIKIPEFTINGYPKEYNDRPDGIYYDRYVIDYYDECAKHSIYESQDLLNYIPNVINELVEAIDFYNCKLNLARDWRN